MGRGVIAEKVAGGVNAADQVGTLLDEVADEEERGADVVLSQQVEEARRPGVVGAVVIGESEFRGIGAGDESVAEDLRLGPKRSVGAASGSEAGGGSGRCDGSDHGNQCKRV